MVAQQEEHSYNADLSSSSSSRNNDKNVATTNQQGKGPQTPYSYKSIVEQEPVIPKSRERPKSFMVHFMSTDGGPQIIVVCLLFALGFGSTIGVVPAVMTDRYARLNHSYSSEMDCASYENGGKPQACLDGSNDAQGAAATANLISNTLTFVTSSMMGSISDEKGRKGIMVAGTFLAVLNPLALVLLQMKPDMSPNWYYAAHAVNGIVSWLAVALSALSDVIPPKWRAASFGLLLAGFSMGFALSPTLALLFDHFHVSVLSLLLVLAGFFLILCFLPETLPPSLALEAAVKRRQIEDEYEATVIGAKRPNIQKNGSILSQTQRLVVMRVFRHVTRPVRELSILNRNKLFRLLSALAFFSGMVSSADQTLLIYYIEEQLSFNDRDVALMFFLIGTLGIIVQGLLIKPINDCIGERYVIVIAFVMGSICNLMYGLATLKRQIFLAAVVSTFVGMSFPTISAIKSNNVNVSEQGRIQGALFSLQALSNGLGPMVLREVYRRTKDRAYPGPGSMFIVASFLYLIAVGCAWALPKDQANSNSCRSKHEAKNRDDSDLVNSTNISHNEDEAVSLL